MDVSVIIPIYKGNEYIESLLNKIEKNYQESQKEIEVIFVNDYPDEEIIVGSQHDFPIRIINNEMRKQRKAGIEEGKAEGRAIGRIAGIKENQEKVIRRLKLMNLSTQQIAKAVELEIKEVEKILNEKQ